MHKLVSSANRFRRSGLAAPLLAVAVGTTAVMTVNAQITYSGLEDLSLNMVTSGTTNTQVLSLMGSGDDEATLEGYTYTSEDYGQLADYASGFEVEGTGSGKAGSMTTIAYNLPAGYTVGSSSSFLTGFSDTVRGAGTIVDGASGTTLAAGASDYEGFEFNPSGSLNLYGWLHFSRSADGNTLTLVDWAYDTSGASILTGAGEPAPEPSTMALGLTGVLLGGIRWYQRRRA